MDAKNVYWSTGSGTIMKIPTSGNGTAATLGTPTTLASGQSCFGKIATDGANVYWINAGTGTPTYNNGSVMKVPVGGGNPPTVLASGQPYPGGIAVDAMNVYWTIGTYGGSVMQTPIIGGSIVTLTSGQDVPGSIAVDAASSAYWANAGVASPGTGVVMKMPAGGSPTVLASGQGTPGAIVLDDSNVYWWNSANGTLVKNPLNGGSPVPVYSEQTSSGQLIAITAFAIDATSVYLAGSYPLGVQDLEWGVVLKLTPK